MNKVFVYGTLKRGNHNHLAYLRGAKFLGSAKILGTCYSLPYGFPAYIDKGSNVVVGEVYEVTDKELANVDILEGYSGRGANDMYRRELITVAMEGEPIEAYIYIWNSDIPKGSKKLASGKEWKKIIRNLPPMKY